MTPGCVDTYTRHAGRDRRAARDVAMMDRSGGSASTAGGRRLTAKAIPRPNAVRYNDWRQADVDPLDAFTPALPVSVVVPSHQTPAKTLAGTLAALERQTYPRDLFEVVLVDDGSEPPLGKPAATALNVKVVRQERRGFGLARARNAGVRAAAHDVLLFLDGDVLVEKDWMAAHARWHHAVSDVVTIGHVAHVRTDGIDPETIRRRRGALKELFADRATRNPGIESHLARTGNLTSRRDDPFRMTSGGNLGVGRKYYELVGGYDESFTRWGFEDTEFGYRAYSRGGLLAPEPDAFAWHQGVWSEGRDAKARSHQLQRGKAAHLIAHPDFRADQPGRIFAVPRFVVTIVDTGAERRSTSAVVRAVANVLADRAHDLVVRIETDAGDDGGRPARLRDEFAPDPRVRVAPARAALDEFPASPFHVVLPAVGFRRGLVRRLRARLGDAVTAAAELPDGTAVSITRGWALHRARRTGRRAADFGEARTLSARALKIRAAGPAAAADAPESECHPDARERLLARARNVHGPRDAWAFLRWLGEGGRRKADTAWRAAGQRLRLARRSRRATGGTVRPAAPEHRMPGMPGRNSPAGARRVVLVASGLAAGGIERYLVRLAVGLERRRHHVAVLKYAPEDFFAGELAAAGVPVEDVHARDRLRLSFAMRRAIRRRRPDVVVACGRGPNVLAVLAGLPRREFAIIVSERGLDVFDRPLKRRMRYALHLLADVVVTNSRAQRRRMTELVPGLEKRIRVIVNDVDLERFSPRPADGGPPERADRLRILVPARISEEKNPVGLLEAADVVRRERPSLRLTIDWYGGPLTEEGGRVPRWELRPRRDAAEYHRRLRQAVAERGMQDRFRLHPAAREVTPLYRAADAVCLPSFREGTSNVVCEAMACGVPLLVSRVGDNPRLVREGRNGLLFDPRSPRDIADAILRFAGTSAEDRRRMGRESRRIAEAALSENVSLDRYVELMDQVSSQKGGTWRS